jgi:cytochrome P450
MENWMSGSIEEATVNGAAAERPGFFHTTDSKLRRDPWREWSRLLSETPVFRSDFVSPGYPESTLWYFLDYKTLYATLRSPAVFSFQGMAHPFTDGDPHTMIPGELDPPEHTKYRRALDPYFTPARIRGLEAAIRATCANLIDALVARGECDLVADFALHFPTSVFMEFLGLPAVDHARVMRWVATFGQSMGTEQETAAAITAEKEVLDYLEHKLTERAAQPRQDFLTVISELTVDGASVSDKYKLSIAYLFFQAGLDTVATELAWMFRYFAENDDDRHAIVADPSLIPSAVEESLRCFSILSHSVRATQDVEVRGCPIKRDDLVVIMHSAANRDPAEFPDPDKFDLARKPNRHMAFGVGPHRCIGSHLARLELAIALDEWHKRIPDYTISPNIDLGQRVDWVVTRMERLPLSWKV